MKIIRNFRSRHPVCAAIIGVLFGPDVVMAYLGRGWLAIFYFVAGLLIAAGQIWLLARLEVKPDYYGYLTTIFLRLVGAIHGYTIATARKTEQRFPWYAHWYSLLLIFVVLQLSVALLIRSLLFQPFTIPASSMAPTLQVGDYMFANKYAYGYGKYSAPFGLGPEKRIFAHTPERGDVVVLRSPIDPQVDYVKRVVGLPGDRIQMKSGVLYLNGDAVPREPAGNLQFGLKTVPTFRETLPSGVSYIVMELSDNSRSDNTAEFKVPEGHYFMLGDNRDNSLDSRFDMGFVPYENIVSKAALVVFNQTDNSRNWIWVK